MKEFSLGSYFLGYIVMTIFVLIHVVPRDIERQKQFDKLQEEYSALQTQYDRDLSTCRTLLSDVQNRIQSGQACYVDGGNNCE